MSFRCVPRPRLVVFFGLASLAVIGCQTPLLDIWPQLLPLELAPEERFQALHMQSFADHRSEEVLQFLEPRKNYRRPVADVFNDALLMSLRQAEAFARVDRDQPSFRDGYTLRGKLLRIETEYPSFSITQTAVSAVCVTRFRLEDSVTGDVLLEEEIVGTGQGAATVSQSGGSTTIHHSDGTMHSGGGGTTTNLTPGFADSISMALAQNIALITKHVVSALVAQASANLTAPVGGGPPERSEPPRTR